MDTFTKTGVRFAALAVLAALLASACAMVPAPTRSAHLGREGAAGACAGFFDALDRRVAAAGVIDAGAFRVPGFPYLRADRFLASFAGQPLAPGAFEAWVDRLQALDRAARRHEAANLAPGELPGGDPARIDDRVAACGDVLRAADRGRLRTELAQAVKAPDDYLAARRVLGLYPLTRLFVAQGVSRWHARERAVFTNQPPRGWQAARYHPPTVGERPTSPGEVLAAARRDALGVPVFNDAQRRALFAALAPIWEVQQAGAADRLGTPGWGADGRLAVDTAAPATYTLVSHTRFEGRVLVQLNYLAWFPARPKPHAWDLFGGLLDGVIYRVTLDGDGAPLLHETVHSCGCYYKAYPAARLAPRPKTPYAEPPLVLRAPPLAPTRETITVAMEARTHYVRHLYARPRPPAAPPAETYALADYGQLRSLPAPGGGRRSMFAQDGLVPGTERLERFILWPTGVLSPGAMRQWGRHAVAFAGRRHFDDPFYMDKMFTRSQGERTPEGR